MKFQIKNRFNGEVLFECELPPEVAGQPYSLQVGFAVKKAVEAGADLYGANLERANLVDANLADTYLTDADLRDADLADANLANANLADANLAGANLAGANLTGANLAGANLTGADLSDASLSGARLSGANAVIDAGVPNGWRCFGWLRDGYLSIRCGCREKRLDEAREYWSESHVDYANRREVVAALDYIEAIAKLRGWKITAEHADNDIEEQRAKLRAITHQG